MIDSEPNILVFVPTYDDTRELENICSKILRFSGQYTVLVVDDGSTPQVNLSILPSSVMVVRLPDNYGLGVATHIAIDHMLTYDYDLLVRIDSDGEHPVSTIPRLVAQFGRGDADVVIGCRANLGQPSGLRGLAANWVRNYYRLIGQLLTRGHRLADLTSGFQALSRHAAETLQALPLERYPEPEVVILATIHGLRVEYVQFDQLDRADGHSSISLRRGVLLLYRFNVFALDQLLNRIWSR